MTARVPTISLLGTRAANLCMGLLVQLRKRRPNAVADATECPCVGRGSVVGLDVGTGGEVDGDGAGVTIWTDGPVLVVSPAFAI